MIVQFFAVVVIFELGFGFGAGAVVLIFVEVELDFAAEVEGVLEPGEFAHEVLQTEGSFVGIF